MPAGAWRGIPCVPSTATTSLPTCSRAAVTTRWSGPSAVRESSSPRPRTSLPRCAAPSPLVSPTWSTWSPTPRSRIRGQPPASSRLADDGDQVPFLDHVALRDVHLGDHARAFGQDRDLHLHRLEDHQGVTVVDVIAFRRNHLPHVRDHLRADFSHRGLLLCPATRDATCLPGTYRSPR